ICGNSFPEDLAKYSLIIQCGGCMHTPRQVQARIEKAQATQCPITNFGVALAYLAGILEKIWIPS
ncbi:MAG: [FeFe] hydrogenase H-cluster maturation GTPase HydF, partial [Niameybacter sp.]